MAGSVARQEVVVGGGVTEPKGSRVGFGSLVVGFWDDAEGGRVLRHAGNVGSGYDDDTLRDLRARLEQVKTSTRRSTTSTSPNDVHWVVPELVVEVGFTEWTHRGRLRHPRFLVVRADKDPDDVTPERPQPRSA